MYIYYVLYIYMNIYIIYIYIYNMYIYTYIPYKLCNQTSAECSIGRAFYN